MVRTTKTVYPKEGTTSYGGMKYTKRPAYNRQNAMKTPLAFESKGQGSKPEKKWLDTNINQELSTTGAITPINTIGQGSDAINRIGNQVKMLGVLIKGAIGVGSTPTSAAVRVIVVYDKQTNGSTPSVSAILTTVSMAGMLNLDYKNRYTIIADECYHVESTGQQVVPVNIYRKMNLNTQFTSTGTSIADISSGSIYVITAGS